MAIKVNQSKQYRIYIKGSKSWVDVNKEFYTNYYRDINAYRKRQQEHGRCVCPASKRYLCDMDCIRKNGEESQTYRHTQTIQGRRNNKCQK